MGHNKTHRNSQEDVGYNQITSTGLETKLSTGSRNSIGDPVVRRKYPQMKTALITGVTGQDGSYLAELLLKKGYEVYGVIRRASSFNTGRIDHLYIDPHEKGVNLKLIYGDLADASSVSRIMRKAVACTR